MVDVPIILLFEHFPCCDIFWLDVTWK